MFLTGPRVVQAALGESVTMEELGGTEVHGRNGVAQLTVADEDEAAALVRELLALLPRRIGDTPDPGPPGLAGGDPSVPVPDDGRKVYDVRDVAAAIFDGGHLLEVSARWAPSMVTALCRLEGRSVGLVANQPRRLGGIIDAVGAEKAASFVDRCQRFGLPLVVLVDTPGFMPGRKQEQEAVIRHGAGLLRAFAGATVPKLTVVLRKAYGGAVITMNSRDLGADVVYAWPGAEIGIMAARQAVGVVHRRELERRAAARRSALRRLRRAAPERPGRGRMRLRRRGDRAGRDSRAPGQDAWLAGSPVSATMADAAPTVEVLSFAALGDSFTAGTGCPPGSSWADRLAASLRRRNGGLAYRNLAREGATSADVQREQLPAALEIEPDLVSVICGANDVLHSVRPDLDGFAGRMAAIFDRLFDCFVADADHRHGAGAMADSCSWARGPRGG